MKKKKYGDDVTIKQIEEYAATHGLKIKAKRVVDKTKKSNIKCEHCKHWCKVGSGNKYVDRQCTNEDSPKNGTTTWYYNRCKCFDWAESEDK